MRMRYDLSAEEAEEIFTYDPDEGVFRWAVTRGRHGKAGAIAGSVNGDGYRQLRVDRVNYRASRIAWLITHRRWPAWQIDHIDGDRLNNRIDNLRETTSRQNQGNRPGHGRHGFKGVVQRAYGRWSAQITDHGKRVHLGSFGSAEEAAAAYDAAAIRIFGEFAMTNAAMACAALSAAQGSTTEDRTDG